MRLAPPSLWERIAVSAAVVVGVWAISGAAHAYCPSYTPAQTAGGKNCDAEPALGKNPAVADWSAIFLKVSGGKASWGTDGPDIGTMGKGCGKPTPTTQVPARFPCHVLEAIAMQESGWRQFCVPDAPAASVGAKERTIVSFDCGYGIGQVTSGMRKGETPTFDRARVASDPTYNLATGTRILRDKWAATRCVGDNDPGLVEDWYTAIWAYNGLAYSNNPNNPNLKAGRGPYNPKNGGAYAYQERVLGWMEFPPTAAHWTALAPAYPDRGEIGGAGSPPALSEPSCASPTSCAQKRSTHTSECRAVASDAGVEEDAGNVGPFAPDDDSGPGTKRTADDAPPADDGGCGCGTSSSRAGSGLAVALGAVGVLLLRRMGRRRKPH